MAVDHTCYSIQPAGIIAKSTLLSFSKCNILTIKCMIPYEIPYEVGQEARVFCHAQNKVSLDYSNKTQ